MKKLVRWVWKPLMGLVLILAVAHGVAVMVYGRRVERTLEAIQARGEPVSLSAFDRKVPPSQNGALIYMQAMERYPGIILDPKGGPPNKQAEKDDTAISQLVSSKNVPRDATMWEQAFRTVAENRDVFPLLERAAASPYCVFPVNWQRGVWAILPHLSPLRSLASLVAADAMLKARDGDVSGAFRSVQLGFRMSESMKEEPFLIGQLVRIAMVCQASRSLRAVLRYGDVDETDARSLFDSLSQMNLTPGYVQALKAERVIGIWAFDTMRTRPELLMSAFSSEPQSKSEAVAVRLLGSYAWRPMLYADQLLYLDRLQKCIDDAARPYRETHARAAKLDALDMPTFAIISRMITPAFSRAGMRRDDAQAEIHGSMVVMALEAWKDRYGTYPESLGDLTDLGWGEMPKDPFSGKDFIYRREGDGFLLYSVGGNLRDDGARPKPGPYAETPWVDYSPGDGNRYADIVWRVSR